MKNIIDYFHNNYGMKWFYISIILLIALLLRLYKLDKIPLGLYADEALFGYNAFCIAETARSENGELLPVFFKAFGIYSNGIFYYVIAFFIKIWGPNIFILRFTSAFIGLLTIFLTYKLSKLYFPKSVALLAALLLALSPWHIQYSRIAMDPITLPLVFVIGLYLFSLGLNGKNKYYIIVSAIPIGISFYCYATARLFIPLFYLLFIVINWKKTLQKKLYILICIFFIFLILVPFILDFKKIQDSRFEMLSITNPYFSIYKTEEKLNMSIKNHFALISTIFTQNYLKHMSADFLLKNGDRNLRHNIGNRGQLLNFTFYMMFLGFFYIIYKRLSNLYIFPIWFLLFPIPAALTWEGLPHASRSICGLPVFEILAAFGFISLLSIIKNNKNKAASIVLSLVIVFVIVMGLNDFKNFVKGYFIDFPKNATAWFDYDIYAISKATESMKDYDQIILPVSFTNVHFLFLQKIEPKKWLENKNILKYVYQEEYKDDYKNYNKKIAAVVRPGQYSYYKTIGYVRHELTDEIMYEIKVIMSIAS